MMFRMFDQIRLTTHRDEHLRRRIHCKLRYNFAACRSGGRGSEFDSPSRKSAYSTGILCQQGYRCFSASSMLESFIIRSLFLRNDPRLFPLAAKPMRNLAP